MLALALLCLLLAPGTWWRGVNRDPDWRNILSLSPLEWQQPGHWPPSLRVSGIWALESPHTFFGGYSALLALPDGRLVAYSDRGSALTFAAPDKGSGAVEFRGFLPTAEIAYNTDFESATRDPGSGRRWIGIETANAVARLSADGEPEKARRPPEMRDWPYNRGAEAMLRLPDGRFIIMGEGKTRFSRGAVPVLLFAGDPVEGASAIRFGFVPPAGLHPTGMAGLPDGRVLILLRGLALAMPPFRARLVVADPRRIRAGQDWPWTPLAELSPPLPRENYEGLATAPTPDGGADIWIISDDNGGEVQRTLLIKLHWRGDAPMQISAPGSPEAP